VVVLNAKHAASAQSPLPTSEASLIIFFLDPFMSFNTLNLTSMIGLAFRVALDLALQDFRAHFSERPYPTWMCVTHNGRQKKGEGLVQLQSQS